MPYSFRNGRWFASIPKEASIMVSNVRRTRTHSDYSGDTSDSYTGMDVVPLRSATDKRCGNQRERVDANAFITSSSDSCGKSP